MTLKQLPKEFDPFFYVLTKQDDNFVFGYPFCAQISRMLTGTIV